MKKLFFSIVFIMCIGTCFSQNFQGIAYYSSQTQMKDFKITSSDMDPAMTEKITAAMKKTFEKSYILNFNNYESVFMEEEKLDAPNPSSGTKVNMFFSGANNSKLYKNFKTKEFTKNADIFDKEFLIKDSLKKYNWKMVEESKTIGNYTCSKAQIIIPVSAEDLKEYEEMKKQQENEKTNFMVMSEPKDQIIEAWYTMDIPVSNGPKDYWGLPGLILELHEGNTTYLCSKIVLNPKGKVEIKAPKNGKKVTQKQFDTIEEEKYNSMKDENGAIQLNMN